MFEFKFQFYSYWELFRFAWVECVFLVGVLRLNLLLVWHFSWAWRNLERCFSEAYILLVLFFCFSMLFCSEAL